MRRVDWLEANHTKKVGEKQQGRPTCGVSCLRQTDPYHKFKIIYSTIYLSWYFYVKSAKCMVILIL